jgi:co-chaperonin GroES (HSP10)
MAEKRNLTKTTFKKSEFRALGDHILVHGMEFRERISRGGIIMIDDDMKSAGIRPRWAQVYAVGPKSKEDIEVGDYIMIAHGRWSRGQTIEDEDGEKVIRKVDPNDILLISKEKVEDYTMTGVDY